MPETPVACAVCGGEPSQPYSHGRHCWDIFCYANPDDHSLMVTGRTRDECVQRWNTLNTHAPARLTLGAFLRRIVGR